MSAGLEPITFVSHTNKPGGGELALRRYLDATQLPVRLVTFEAGGVWDGVAEVVEVSGLRGLRKAIRGGGLVVANSMRSAFLVALVLPTHARLVYWVRDGLTNSAMSRLALTLTRYVTARKVTHYLANSAWTAATVCEALKVAPSQIDVVTSLCGVPAAGLARTPRPAPSAPLRLLYLGRISGWKAPDVAVRALQPLRNVGIDATLTIAGGAHFGEDNYADRLHQLVADESAATMVGHVDDVPQLLEEHDLLVHCSSVPEPFGQVLVQGLAAAMPVVATGHGGPAEILAGAPVPLTYESVEPGSLADAVQQVLTSYQDVSAWALTRAAQFTDEGSVARTDHVLTSIPDQQMPSPNPQDSVT